MGGDADSNPFLKERQFLILVLAVLMQPVRMLCNFFHAQSIKPIDRTRWPPLLDLLHPEYSLLLATRQFFSGMLSGKSPRLQLLWRKSKATSVEDWFLRFPAHVALVRRVVLIGACWLERRFGHFSDLDLKVFLLADTRCLSHEKQDFLSKLRSTRFCCLPPGLCRQLRHRGVSTTDLSEPEWARCLLAGAWAMWLSIACVELRHARNRVLAQRPMPFHTFSACSLHAEAFELMRARQRVQEMETAKALGGRQESQSLEVGEDKSESNNCGLLRAQSPLMLFRKEWLALQKERGLQVKACSAETWAKIRSEFAALPAAETARLGSKSVATQVIAAENRRLKARAGPNTKFAAIADDQPEGRPAAGSSWSLARLSDHDVSCDVQPCCFVNSVLADPKKLKTCTTVDSLVEAMTTDQTMTGQSSEWPLHQHAIRDFLAKSPGSEGMGQKSAASVWASESQTIVPPSPLPPPRLPQRCGAFCRARVRPQVLAQQETMLKHLARLCKSWAPAGQHGRFPELGCVCAFEVHYSGSTASSVTFATIPVCSGQAGPLQARQQFAMLDVVGTLVMASPYEGLVLEHNRRQRQDQPHVTDKRSWLGRGACGEFHIVDEDTFTARLLSCEQDIEVTRVCCKRLLHSLPLPPQDLANNNPR